MTTLVLALQCILFTIALLGMSVFLTFALIFLIAVVIAIVESIIKLFKKEKR